jgi:hypothetical protein
MSDIFGHAAEAFDQHELLSREGLADDHFSDSVGKLCKHCHTPFLHWEATVRGYRLFDREGRIHACSAYIFKREMSKPSPF